MATTAAHREKDGKHINASNNTNSISNSNNNNNSNTNNAASPHINTKFSAYKTEPYKTEPRRDVITKRRELARAHNLARERMRGQVGKTVSRNLVTIDTHKSRTNIEVLRLVIRDLGWREFPFLRRDHNCDVTWHAVSFYDQTDLYSGQVNKFPGSLEVFRKVNLFRWLEFMKTLFPEEYSFFPRTWLLPHQFNEFAFEVRQMNEKKAKQKPTFIVKPSEGSQGDGIYLLRDPQAYSTSGGRAHVVQEYMSNVFLLERFKFDFRVYVVIKSMDPLELHICREGLARFSTIPYEQPTKNNLDEIYMHLTNYSLNKKSSNFKISEKDDEGSKRKLTAVFRQMEGLGHDMEAVWVKIEQLVCKTMIAVAGELKVELQGAVPPGKPGPTCFQVLGFDILLLKNLEPILLEVNSNPSLSITEEHETPTGGIEYAISAKDEEIKRKLIRDTLILIAPKNKYTRKRRKHRKRRRHRNTNYNNSNNNNSNNDDEEAMDVDEPGSQGQGRQPRRRERDVSIRYMDVEEDGHRPHKSIFDESDYIHKRFTRTETCRVFIEGEGEVLFSDTGPSNPKYFSGYKDPKEASDGGQNNSNNMNANNKNSIMKANGGRQAEGVPSGDTSDRLPSVFFKSGDRPVDIIMEDEDEGEGKPSRPVPFDLSLLDSSDEEEEEEESCLKEIFPSLYSEQFKTQRIVERLSDIFITCLGVKGCLRLGPTMFRLFARKCRLNRKGITNAAIDILYIDMQRKWEYMNPDRTSGLCFLGFVSACYEISRRKFYDPCRCTMLQSLLDHCEDAMQRHHLQHAFSSTRALVRRDRSSRTSIDLFGNTPGAGIGIGMGHGPSVEEESVRQLFVRPNRRQGTFLADLHSTLKERQQRTYLPRTFTHDLVFQDD